MKTNKEKFIQDRKNEIKELIDEKQLNLFIEKSELLERCLLDFDPNLFISDEQENDSIINSLKELGIDLAFIEDKNNNISYVDKVKNLLKEYLLKMS